MYTREGFESMTVIRLREIARENDIRLSAGISKSGIVDRLCEELIKDELPSPIKPEPQAEASSPVIRPISMPANDEPDPGITSPTPSFTRVPLHTPSRTASPLPPHGPATVNRGNVPGTNKPVFSLEGVRAWSNPRPQQNTSASTYQQRSAVPIGERRQPSPYGDRRPAARPFQTVNRFGPDATTDNTVEEERPRMETPVAEDRLPLSNVLSESVPPRQPVLTREPPVQREPAQSTAGTLPDLLAAPETDGCGTLNILDDGSGVLHVHNYMPSIDDIIVSHAQIRRFKLMTGDQVSGKVRLQGDAEKKPMLIYVTHVNGIEVGELPARVPFDSLTAVYPTVQIPLASQSSQKMLRTIDLVAPIGLGQRALIVAPPRCGKTELLKEICASVMERCPDAQMITLLPGERAEDITAARENLPGEVIASGFGTPSENITLAAALVTHHAMRMAEMKKNVVVVIDNLTNLCRAYNECAPQNARTMTGGLAAGCLNQPKRIFGAARALKEGGSLTVIAVLASDTGNPLDAAIADEFCGFANMEVHLTTKGSIDLFRSTTRKRELMQSPDIAAAAEKLRSYLCKKAPEEATAELDKMFEKTASNSVLLRRVDEITAQ